MRPNPTFVFNSLHTLLNSKFSRNSNSLNRLHTLWQKPPRGGYPHSFSKLKKRKDTMLHKAFNPQDSNNLHGRCQHRSAKGRQCRTPLTAAHGTLCPRHAAALRDDSVDLSALLASEVPEKKSAA